MRLSLRRLLIRGLVGAALLGVGGVPVFAADYSITRDIAYAEGYVASSETSVAYVRTRLRADLYDPERTSDAPRTAVVMLHGGGFKSNDRRHDKLVWCAKKLAALGYVCFAVDYRMMPDDPPAPEPFHALPLAKTVHAATVDAKAAIRYVRAKAIELQVDPDRIAVLGESAGAITALNAGLSDEDDFLNDGDAYPMPDSNHPGISSRPNAIVDLWGSAQFVRDKFDRDDPPVLIIHGTDDQEFGVMFPAALALVKACEEASIPHTFYPLEGVGHGEIKAEYNGKNIPQLVDEFLRAQLK